MSLTLMSSIFLYPFLVYIFVPAGKQVTSYVEIVYISDVVPLEFLI